MKNTKSFRKFFEEVIKDKKEAKLFKDFKLLFDTGYKNNKESSEIQVISKEEIEKTFKQLDFIFKHEKKLDSEKFIVIDALSD